MPDDGATNAVIAEVNGDTESPAQGADEQKPAPETGADEQKPEAAKDGTSPEQEAERKLSRRQRAYQRERDRRIAVETELRLEREQNAKLREQSPSKQDTGEPKRDQFDNYEDYLRAVTRWEAKQAVSTQSDSSEQRPAPRQSSNPDQERIARTWNEAEAKFQETHKDYEAVVSPFVEEDLGSLSTAARHAIAEYGPAVLYHLATHDDDFERIAKLSPARQVAELGKIEETLSKPAERKQSSSAPAPATPGPQGKTSGAKDPEKMSVDEFNKFMKSHGVAWAR